MYYSFTRKRIVQNGKNQGRGFYFKKKKLRRKFTAERVIVIKFITGACCCVTETLACPYLPSSIT